MQVEDIVKQWLNDNMDSGEIAKQVVEACKDTLYAELQQAVSSLGDKVTALESGFETCHEEIRQLKYKIHNLSNRSFWGWLFGADDEEK